MPPLAQPLRATLAFALALFSLADAYAVTPAEKPYVGGYIQGSVDSSTELMLLDDNTFCFSFTGGSLDMLAGGHWKAEGDGVRLQEVRETGSVFPAFGQTVAEQKESVTFDFHGRSLSNATSAVFATSNNEALPTTMRPLFEADHNGWSSSYKLPPLPAARVRYFYMGDVEGDDMRQPKRLRVVQYRRGDANALRVGYNRVFGNPPLNLAATLKDDELHVDGRRFGTRKDLPEKNLRGIRVACIWPALAQAAAAESSANVRPPPLVPVKTFYLPLTAIQGAPYFPGTDK